MIARRVLTIFATVLIAITIVRNAAVGLLAQSAPSKAARLWPGHPDVEIASAMTQIALAAKAGRAAPAQVFPLLQQAAQSDPLAPEPFLVRGVQAQLAGDPATARHAFEAAQWRDPRSLPAAYFLADQFVRSGDIADGLRQIAAFARLSPNGAKTAGPYLASFAGDRANWPELRSAFRANPGLAEPTFDALSADIQTVPSLLALASPSAFTPTASWMPRLLDTLINAGQYDQARSIWARTGRIRTSGLLHDRGFTDRSSLPPFNWSLTSNSVGLAERQPGGRLHVLYYGQEDGTLATQLLILRPGTYRFSYKALGGRSGEGALTWSVWCDKANAPLNSVGVEPGGDQGMQFTVPANCPAQWLRLSGASDDIAQQIDLAMSDLNLVGVRSA